MGTSGWTLVTGHGLLSSHSFQPKVVCLALTNEVTATKVKQFICFFLLMRYFLPLLLMCAICLHDSNTFAFDSLCMALAYEWIFYDCSNWQVTCKSWKEEWTFNENLTLTFCFCGAGYNWPVTILMNVLSIHDYAIASSESCFVYFLLCVIFVTKTNLCVECD